MTCRLHLSLFAVIGAFWKVTFTAECFLSLTEILLKLFRLHVRVFFTKLGLFRANLNNEEKRMSEIDLAVDKDV